MRPKFISIVHLRFGQNACFTAKQLKHLARLMGIDRTRGC